MRASQGGTGDSSRIRQAAGQPKRDNVTRRAT